ncbi:glycine dehydrogenase subunit 2, partial [mine drainage metagenome]
MSFRQARWEEPPIWELAAVPEAPAPPPPIPGVPERLRRKRGVRWPELSELEIVRHYTRLSQMNFGIDTSFYPLGSCTMKY